MSGSNERVIKAGSQTAGLLTPPTRADTQKGPESNNPLESRQKNTGSSTEGPPSMHASNPGGEEGELKGIFVDLDPMRAEANYDGKSWKTAFKTIAEGIKSAGSSGLSIYIAAGVHTDQNINLSDTNNIHLIGGYQSGERILKDRTELGDQNLTVFKNPGSLSSLIVLAKNAKNLTLDGFTFISDGSFDSALLIEGADKNPVNNIALTNCRFLNFKTKSPILVIEQANGVKLSNLKFSDNRSARSVLKIAQSKKISIENSNFEKNNELTEAALNIDACDQVALKNLKFSNNSTYSASFLAQGYELGGGLSIKVSDNVTLENLAFYENRADNGASLYIADSAVSIKNTIFSKNLAIHNGGAIRFVASTQFYAIKPKLTLLDDVQFVDNQAFGDQGGGAISAGFMLNENVRTMLAFESPVKETGNKSNKNQKGNFLSIRSVQARGGTKDPKSFVDMSKSGINPDKDISVDWKSGFWLASGHELDALYELK